MKVIAIDTETLLSNQHVPCPRLVCLSYAEDDGAGVISHWQREEMLLILTDAFENCVTVFAHARFDLFVIMRYAPELMPLIYRALEEDRVHDVLIRQRLFQIAGVAPSRPKKAGDEGGTVSLNECSEWYFGRKMEKDDYRYRYHDLYATPLDAWPWKAIDYATVDAETTLAVWRSQEMLAAAVHDGTAKGCDQIAHVLADQHRQTRKSMGYHASELRGLRSDPKRAAVELAKRQAMIDACEGYLLHRKYARYDEKDATITRDEVALVKLAAHKRLRTLTDAGKAYMLTRRPDGLSFSEQRAWTPTDFDWQMLWAEAGCRGVYLSVDKEAVPLPKDLDGFVERLRGDMVVDGAHEFVLEAAVLHKRLVSEINTIRMLASGDEHPVRTRYVSLVDSGRGASTGPNLQNIPRAPGIREVIVPREGYVFIASDLSGAELACFAQVCLTLVGRSRMAELLELGRDLHSAAAAERLGLLYDVFIALKKTDPKTYKDNRQLMKAVNFGRVGLCGPESFVAFAKGYGVEVSLDEAKNLLLWWDGQYLEAVDYFEMLKRAMYGTGRNKREGKAVLIRQLFSYRTRRCTSLTSAANSYMQGLLADLMGEAQWELHRRQMLGATSDPLTDTWLVLNVHDELIIECPEWKYKEAAAALTDVLERAAKRWTPGVKLHAETTVMDRWTKSAEPVYLPDGTLGIFREGA